MEDAAWRGRDIDRGDAFGVSFAKRLLTRWGPSIGLISFFFLTVLVYYLTNSASGWPWEWRWPEPTGFNGPVRVADALLHGRVDVANGADLPYLEWAPYKGKYYAIDPPMSALVLLPGVILYGLALNQTLVSIVIGGITAASIYRLMRGLTEKLSAQVWLTLLFVFGTIFWWAATSGANWYYSHVVAMLFLFLAIYETLVAKRPFLAGLFLGAAYLSRLTPILALPFFLIMFSDQWLPQSGEKSLLRRIDLKPLLLLGSGVGIFLVASFIFNYLQFETPLPASRTYYFDQFDPRPLVLEKGLFHISHISRHMPAFFTGLPIFQSNAPYVLPSLAGLAIWGTTPAFLYALFAGVKKKVAIRAGLAILAITLGLIVLTNGTSDLAPGGLHLPFDYDPPYGLTYYPFVLLIGYSLFAAIQNGNKLVIASWSAVIPIALVHFTFFAPPPSFGYQYALDYYPFLFLLTWAAIGDKIRWHHMALITLAITINLWGVLWIHRFNPDGYLGLEWLKF